MKFIFRFVVWLLKIFNPKYYAIRRIDKKGLDYGDAQKILDHLKDEEE